MNRYNRGPTIGGPSKATASTTCQKCLKKGHYSYECKAVVQERPYVSRPSRTQQLLNPKLVPRLTSDVPQDLLRKKGVADEQLAKLELERERKRDRESEDSEIRRKRMRSASSVSVSTISTGMSRSPSPHQAPRDLNDHKPKSSSQSHSSHRPRYTESEKKRRRDSTSSVESYNSEDRRNGARNSVDRNTRKRFQEHSPPERGRQTESRSPDRRRRPSNDRQRISGQDSTRYNRSGPPREQKKENRAPPRERSLSPFSKRLALTQAINTAR